jgi:hypothetical protein
MRGQLPAVAQRRARDELGVHVAGHDVVVIGDTGRPDLRPRDRRARDWRCHRVLLCRRLRQHEAAAIFQDLRTEDVVRVIVADAMHRADTQ